MEVQSSVSALPVTGPVLVASRSNLVPSTDPLAASNVEFGRGLQPPSSDVVQNWIPSPTSPTPPATSFEGGAPIELTGGTVTIQHVPITDLYQSTNSAKNTLYTASAGKANVSNQQVNNAQGVSSNAALVADLAKFLDGPTGQSNNATRGGILASIDIKA